MMNCFIVSDNNETGSDIKCLIQHVPQAQQSIK